MTCVVGDWLTDPAAQRVLRMLGDAGHQAYVVGGCVRNALMGRPVADVDIATDARPDTVLALAKQAGLRAVPTGIDHGTVTVIVDGTGFEITTFRADIATDGRHASVRFSDHIMDDARRRDFTINALYCDAQGHILDPLNGLPDVHARRIRFVEDPDRRIKEDYLRILRFFRFAAWYGDPADGLDADALAAIAANLDGLVGLSRERIGSEVTKLLTAPDPSPAVAAMQMTGVLAQVLPGTSPQALGPLIHNEGLVGIAPDPLRRLAALGFADGAGLRLSRADQRQLAALRDAIGGPDNPATLGYRLEAGLARDVILLRAAVFEQPLDRQQIAQTLAGSKAHFPVKARDLMPMYTGAALGARLTELELRWIESNFVLDKAALLVGD